MSDLHWILRDHLKEFREDGRLFVLLSIYLHKNTRNRSWPTNELIHKETDLSSSSVSNSIQWLKDHKAIILVPYPKRVGDEKKLAKRKNIYQLTGVVEIEGKFLPYIYMNPEGWRGVISELADLGESSQGELLQACNHLQSEQSLREHDSSQGERSRSRHKVFTSSVVDTSEGERDARADETPTSEEISATPQAAQNAPPIARRPPKAKRDLTETEVWQRRLDTVLPLTSAMLAKMEQGYDPAFNQPQEYMTLALLKKYVPIAEGLGFLRMTPEQFFKLWGEIEAEYKPKGWKIAVKTIEERAPSFMLRIKRIQANGTNGTPKTEPVIVEPVTLTPDEIAARKAALDAARQDNTNLPEVA